VLPPLRPGALDDLLERYLNHEHPLSRTARPGRKSSLRVMEARLEWSSAAPPTTPADVILRQLLDEEAMRQHPGLNSAAMLWEFRRHRLSLFGLHMRQSWAHLLGQAATWRREAFEAGDWSRLGDTLRVLARAARASCCLSAAAVWTIGFGRPMPEPRQVRTWAGRLAPTRLEVATRAA
jgi:hypothetical protein